ncbi:MAG: iron-containing alcohol dehydrogenase [Clostridium sp.]
MAFGNTGTGAVHALSYPLSGIYHVTHGKPTISFSQLYSKHMKHGKNIVYMI